MLYFLISATLCLLISFDISANSIWSIGLESFILWRFLIKSFVSLDSLPVSSLTILPPTSTAHSVTISLKLLFTASRVMSPSSVRAEYLLCSEILNSSALPLTANSFMGFFLTNL
uniref:Putative secreted protein n=1 Tax=Amblyomma triste TaxID=251400 RepID=A0A023G1Q8_AMBTT